MQIFVIVSLFVRALDLQWKSLSVKPGFSHSGKKKVQSNQMNFKNHVQNSNRDNFHRPQNSNISRYNPVNEENSSSSN